MVRGGRGEREREKAILIRALPLSEKKESQDGWKRRKGEVERAKP